MKTADARRRGAARNSRPDQQHPRLGLWAAHLGRPDRAQNGDRARLSMMPAQPFVAERFWSDGEFAFASGPK